MVLIDKSTATASELIAAPGAGKRLAIDFITVNPSGGANTVTLTCNITIPLLLDDNQPFTFENSIHDPEGVLHCNDNQAFSLTLSAATRVTGYLLYRVINA